MINEKDYEGHTKGPWQFDVSDPWEIEDASGHTSDACDIAWVNEEKQSFGDSFDGDPAKNALLIRDAPIILAELVAERNKVCEWRLTDLGSTKKKCGIIFPHEISSRLFIRAAGGYLTYCPGCGGRIKVVEP